MQHFRYALRNRVALTHYAEDGRLKIDNNGAEQALRPIVLGRKNWLFAGSEAAAHRTAILCSLVQTCKHLQVNPFVYLRDVIERVSTHPARLVQELTPRQWSACGGIPARKPPPERRVSYTKAAPPAGFVDLNLRINRYLRPRSSLLAAGRWRWSWSYAY